MSKFAEERAIENPARAVRITKAIPPESVRPVSEQKYVLCAFEIINYTSELQPHCCTLSVD